MDPIFVLDENLHEVHDKYYADIPEDIFIKVLAIDPTYTENKMGKYGKWLLNVFKKDSHILDDSEEVKDQLDIFDKNKMKYDVPDRDINRIKTLADLIDINHRYEKAAEKSEYELKAETFPGVQVIGSTPDWEIYRPLSWDASKYLRGQNAVWCTGRHNDNSYWKSYVERRGEKLYIFINKHDRDKKYQAAINPQNYVSEFRDARNGGMVFPQFLVDNQDILKVLERDPDLKDLRELKTVNVLLELKQGKPFVYDGQSSIDGLLKPNIKYITFKSTDLKPSLFEGFKSLEELDLPEGIEEIPLKCFYDCDNLKKVHLPDSLKGIGAIAFANCINLEQINFPKDLEEVGFKAFNDCDKVTITAIKGSRIIIKKSDIDFIKAHIKWEVE